MKSTNLIIVFLLLISFGLNAQDQAPFNNLKLSVSDLFLKKSASISYEKYIKKGQYLEVGLNVPLMNRTRSFDFNLFSNDIESKETILSVGYKIYPNAMDADLMDEERFNGFFIKPELYIGYQNKYAAEYNCSGFLCNDQPEFNSEKIIYGAMLNGGYQWRINKELTLETSLGIGYGFGHSDKTRFTKESKSGSILTGSIGLGYSF